MSDVSMDGIDVDRIERRCLEFMDRMESRVQKGRYSFPYRDMTADRKELPKIGGSFWNHVLAFAYTEGRLDPGELDEELGESFFWQRAERAYSRYGGYSGAQSAAQGSDPKGIQQIFNAVADALASEIVQNGLGAILDDEVDSLNYQEVRSVALQLQRKAGIEGTPLFQIMQSWKDIILARVMMKREMKKRFGQV